METEKNLNPEADQSLEKGSISVRSEIAKIGGPIELEKVRKWTQNYRRMNDKDTTAHLFGRKVIEKLLAQKDCQGIRMHYCIDDTGKKQLVLSGVDHNGKDQLPQPKQMLNANAAPQAAGEDYRLVDQSWPCPETKGCAVI